jgi:aminoglycoside phosphotransferase family enzyme/predicted kinase
MTSRLLLHSLLDSVVYPHSVETISYVQTHLSYVILTGQYAYKVKKPVNLGFQDFSSLAKRRHYCELECELNKTLAPHLYLGVVPITGSEMHPRIGGEGPIIEWAIKMHQFPEDCLLTNVLARGELTLETVNRLAAQAATFHQRTSISLDGVFGTPQSIHQRVIVNFEQLRRLLSDPEDFSTIQTIETWAHNQFQKLLSHLSARKAQGCIRACHGDMHLGNTVLWEGTPTFFDCIEFNEDFRWTDVMNDVAFMAMDLTFHGRADFANYFVNRYFEYTGDYEGAPLLRYYMSYRAMVRAKIAGYLIEQNPENDALVQNSLATCRAYLQLAKKLCHPTRYSLTITHGISGSGKSSASQRWMMEHGAVRLRSDVERKRLCALAIFEPTPVEIKETVYSAETTQKTFDYLYQLANYLLNAKMPVVVDAAFLKQKERLQFQALATQLDIPFHILTLPTPSDSILENRLIRRACLGNEASDASFNIALGQKKWVEPLTEEERAYCILTEGGGSVDTVLYTSSLPSPA